jgi:uncharacterized membrane protein
VVTPASVRKHPIHPMLAVFPIGLWVFSFICDVVYVTVGGPLWSGAALLAILGGIIGAVAAAIPGLIDFWSLRASAFRTALTHLALNALALTVFIVSAFSRSIGGPYSFSMTLSAVGIVSLVFSGWLGGELVYVRGVAVESVQATPGRG